MKHSYFVKWILVFIASSVAGIVCLCFIIRDSVASEGYDTNEAAWNYLVRNGEIRFRLAGGNKITAIKSSGVKGVIHEDDEASISLGYGIFFTELEYVDSLGGVKLFSIETSKLNNWNRVLYVQDDLGGFIRFDNGVLQLENK